MANYANPYGGYSEDELRAKSEAMADSEFAMPYIHLLDRDPVARIGFDPSRIDIVPFNEPHYAGFYSRYGADWSTIAKNAKEFLEKNRLDRRKPISDDMIYILQNLSSKDFQPIAMHEARHRGLQHLGITDHPLEETYNRYEDALRGVDFMQEKLASRGIDYKNPPAFLEDFRKAVSAKAISKSPTPIQYKSPKAVFDPEEFERQVRDEISSIDAKWMPKPKYNTEIVYINPLGAADESVDYAISSANAPIPYTYKKV